MTTSKNRRKNVKLPNTSAIPRILETLRCFDGLGLSLWQVKKIAQIDGPTSYLHLQFQKMQKLGLVEPHGKGYSEVGRRVTAWRVCA